jgi:hypothetical protein
VGKKTITFAIDNENGITAYPSRKEAEAAGEGSFFSSAEQLDQVTTGCPGGQLIEIWNGIPGVEPVKKFTSRRVALGRIWKAIQALAPEAEGSPDVAPQAAHVEPKPARPSTKATAAKKPHIAAKGAQPPRGSKTAQVIEMIRQPGGATLAAIMKATGWLPHTTRSFMSTAPKKLGIEVVSAKVDGERTYSTETKAAAGV